MQSCSELPVIVKPANNHSPHPELKTTVYRRTCPEYHRCEAGVGVLDRHQVQSAVFHTEPGSAVFLSHQYNRHRPRAVTRLNLATGQHLSNTSLLLFNLRRRHPARGTADRPTVPGVNGMLHCIRVSSQSRAGHRKQVNELQQGTR